MYYELQRNFLKQNKLGKHMLLNRAIILGIPAFKD